MEEKRADAPSTDVPKESCATADCHGNVKQHAALHGPLYVNACDACHELVDPAGHSYRMARPSGELCLHCHEFQIEKKNRIHEPIVRGECLGCHDPHGGNERASLRQEGQSEACESCHGDTTRARPVVHDPLLEEDCGACHKPHASPHTRLLTEENPELCLECHASLRTELETAPVAHSPVESDCLVCHDPHASGEPSLLKADPASLCLSCHEEIAHNLDSPNGQHSAVTMKRACLNCHTPHAGQHPGLLRADVTSLCLDCHDKPLERVGGGEVVSIREILEDRIYIHDPVTRSGCTSCHMVHGGGFDRLLNQEFSLDFYNELDASTYSLCFSCHDQQLSLLAESAQVTRFRNGTRNLHFVHVNNERKSRSCMICHDPHASDNPHQLHDTIAFGPVGWPLPIGWKATDNGGTCAAGCHPAIQYDRIQPVTYSDGLMDDPEGAQANSSSPEGRSPEEKPER